MGAPQKYTMTKRRENLRRYDWKPSNQLEMKFPLPFFVCKLSAVALEKTKARKKSKETQLNWSCVRTALSQNVEDMTSFYHQCRGKACPLAMPVQALGKLWWTRYSLCLFFERYLFVHVMLCMYFSIYGAYILYMLYISTLKHHGYHILLF